MKLKLAHVAACLFLAFAKSFEKVFLTFSLQKQCQNLFSLLHTSSYKRVPVLLFFCVLGVKMMFPI